MAKVTKDMTIGEILSIGGEAVIPALLQMGMHCIGCPASQMETLEEAAQVHGIDASVIEAQINEALA